MTGPSKRIKRLIREYAGEAHERELHLELSKLGDSIDEWRRGEITSGELSDRIHAFHQGPSRELWKQYNYGDAELNVAYALVAGLLDREQVPAELIEALARPLEVYQSMMEQGELRLPGKA